MKPTLTFTLRSFLLCGGVLLFATTAQSQLTWDANGTGAGQTNGAGAWTGTNLWWNGTANTNWVSASDAILAGTATAGATISLAAPTTVGSFTFSPSFTGTYTLGSSGQAITVNSGITKSANSAAVAFASPITLGAAQTWTNDSATTLSTSNGTNLINNGSFQLTIDGAGATTFGVINNDLATLTGSGNLVKNGTGVLSLSGVNAGFTGNVTVNSGVLRVTKPTSVSGNVNLTGGVYEHYWSDAYTRSLGNGAGQIQITGGVSGFSENGNTGVTFTVNNDATSELQWGSAFFSPSTFVLQADTAQGSSSLTLANKLDLNAATRTIFVSGGTTGAARATISGQIRTSSGTAGFTKTGAGLLSLSNGANAWNGATTVSGGTLDLGAMTNANLSGGTGRNVTVAAGAGIRFNVLSNAFLNRIVETADEITVMTGGTNNNLDFSSSTGANLPGAFLGNWVSNGAKAEYGGTLTPAADSYRLGGKASSGLLGIVGTNKLTGSRGLIVGITGGTAIRVELAAANDFSGNTVINTGAKLTIGNNLALQNSALNLGSAGGTFALSDGTNAGRITGDVASPSPTFGGLLGSRNLFAAFASTGGNNETLLAATAVTGFTLNAGTGKTHTYSGVIGGFGAGASGGVGGASTLTKTGDGTQILSGSNTYTGLTDVKAGTLGYGVANVIANAGSVRISGGTLDIATFNDTVTGVQLVSGAISGTTGILTSTSAFDLQTGAVSGILGGSVGLNKTTAGTVTLSGANSYSGPSNVTDGTLLVNGNQSLATGGVNVAAGATLGGTGIIGGIVTTSGILSPGASIETLAAPAVTFNPGSSFAYELNSSGAPATGADLMKVTGNLSLSGTVVLTITDLAALPVAYSPGTTFSLFNYTGTWNGGEFSIGGNALSDDEIFTAGLNTWQISYNDGEGGLNYAGEYAGGADSFVNLTIIPEPSVAMLGLTALGLLVRRRR